jgi:Tol biopolymer transport system component
MLPFSEYRLYLILIVVLILGSLWIYSNWYFNLNRLFPFNDLTNKIAIDGLDIIDFSDRSDNDEIYLVDTTSNAIRQLTNDNYRDELPNISFSNSRIYFVSNRFLGQDKSYGKSYSSI